MLSMKSILLELNSTRGIEILSPIAVNLCHNVTRKTTRSGLEYSTSCWKQTVASGQIKDQEDV